MESRLSKHGEMQKAGACRLRMVVINRVLCRAISVFGQEAGIFSMIAVSSIHLPAVTHRSFSEFEGSLRAGIR